mgnify:FL=1
MEINRVVLENLFSSICDRVRTSVRQSNHSVVQQAAETLSSQTGQAESLHVIAASALTHSDPDRTLKTIDRIDRWQEFDAVANRLAGFAWLMKGHHHHASCCLERAVSLAPDLPDCWFFLGRIAEEDGLTELAIKSFQRGAIFEDAPHQCALALARLFRSKRHLTEAIHTLRVSLIRDRRSADLNLALARH